MAEHRTSSHASQRPYFAAALALLGCDLADHPDGVLAELARVARIHADNLGDYGVRKTWRALVRDRVGLITVGPNGVVIPNRVIVDRGRTWRVLSIRYSERLADAGIAGSVGGMGDSYDNALAETINGL